MSDDRAAKLATIAEQIKACQLCALYQNTLNAVPGSGNIYAEIMFIGEAPGEQEDKQGHPFVGRSGQYLDYLLKLIGLSRETVFITNVVKHRPPANRDPLPDEIIACKPYLDQQIALIDPLVIVTLGRFSMARYFPDAKISAIHGRAKFEEGRAYYPMFHPAAALRNPQLRWDMEADIKRLLDIVAQVKQQRTPLESMPTPPAEQHDAPPPPNDEDDDAPPIQLSLF
jgi:DNA polymerase